MVIVQKANKNKSCSGVNCTIIVGKYLSIVTASINQYNFFSKLFFPTGTTEWFVFGIQIDYFIDAVCIKNGLNVILMN